MSFGPTEIIVLIVIVILVWIAFRGLGSSGDSDEGFSGQPRQKPQGRRVRETPVKAEIDWHALNDPQVQDAISRDNKIEAIKHYRLLTDQGLKDSKDAIEYAVAHPDIVREKKKGSSPTTNPVSFPTQSPRMPEINREVLGDLQIQAALGRNDEIEAIKRYRELTGQSLQAAKDVIEFANANPEAIWGQKTRGDDTPDANNPKLRPESDPRIVPLVLKGNKIEAIKIYRELTGLGLKEAKDAIDALEKSYRL